MCEPETIWDGPCAKVSGCFKRVIDISQTCRYIVSHFNFFFVFHVRVSMVDQNLTGRSGKVYHPIER